MASGGFLFATTILLLLAVPSWGLVDCTQQATNDCISDNTDPGVQCAIPGDAYRCLQKVMSTCSTDDDFHAAVVGTAAVIKAELDKCPDLYEKRCFEQLVKECAKPDSYDKLFHLISGFDFDHGVCQFFNGSVTTMTNCFQDLKPKCDDSGYLKVIDIYLESLTQVKKECDF